MIRKAVTAWVRPSRFLLENLGKNGANPNIAKLGGSEGVLFLLGVNDGNMTIGPKKRTACAQCAASPQLRGAFLPAYQYNPKGGHLASAFVVV